MTGLGTVINTAAIVAGGLIGLAADGQIKKVSGLAKSLTLVMGLSTLFIGGAGVLSEMLVFDGAKFSTRGTMVMIFSLVLGCITGELLNIEAACEKLGAWLKDRTGNSKDTRFIGGFMTASLTVCIGAMAVLGSIEDGISGDFSILLTKAVLDFLIIIVMTASLGAGCIFSAIPVAIAQGSMTLLARLIGPFITDAVLSNLSLVGSALIFCVGVNLAFDRHIKVGNLLPAIFFAIALTFVPFF